MPEKWTGELAPPPYWLKPEMEVTTDPPQMTRGEFVVTCIEALLLLGTGLDRAFGVTANTVNETGWGEHRRGNNLGGWKINKSNCKNVDGSPRQWFRALGNKSSGDPQTCFYRAFPPGFVGYYAEWLERFVPKPPNSGRYGATGARFWSGLKWFPALIDAGYKGERTKARPGPSIAEHESIVRTLAVFWAQHLLGTTPDGDWGPKSRAACKTWQEKHDLEPTGHLDPLTRQALFG